MTERRLTKAQECGCDPEVNYLCEQHAKERQRDKVIRWLQERLDNCHAIAAKKYGDDRAGWIEDAMYFQWAIEMLQ